MTLYAALDTLKIDFMYFIDSDKNKQGSLMWKKIIKGPEALQEENLDEIFILVAVPTRYSMKKQLDELGLVENYHYSNLDGYNDTLGLDLFDPFLGFSRSDDLPGFRICGDKNKKNKKIVLLGSSNTDPALNSSFCWGNLLYEKLRDLGESVTIFNGGIGAYSSSQEMLKLIRDCLCLEPDIIISLNGVNDFYANIDVNYPLVHTYLQGKLNNIFKSTEIKSRSGNELVSQFTFGIKNSLEMHEIWLRNVRIMNSVSSEFGIKYLCFLQPTFSYGRYCPSEKEKLFHENLRKIYKKTYNEDHSMARKEFYEKAVRESRKYEYIIDLTSAFDGLGGIYLDLVHYDIKGNHILADLILEKIKEIL